MPPPRNVTTPADRDRAGYVTPPGRSRNMAAIRRTDTKHEVALRSALHRRGYRFRKDFPIRSNGKLIRPDIAFTRCKVAVFIDGCFWHCCPEHGRMPKVNGGYWPAKLEGNVRRDQQQTATLQSAGWTVLRFWDHEPIEITLATIETMIARDTSD